ncbi:MAG: hypothetical protein ACJ79K_00175 [Gemmatimonadaceae bacterium]
MRPLSVTALALLALAGCHATDRPTGPPPPRAEFLVAAGDSTFWVRTTPDGVRRRGSSMLLARFGGNFYEIYTADEDRSFYDALFVGQRVYRRDLVTGDSALVYRDTIVPAAERQWVAIHPDEAPLAPDEDANDHPVANASADVELLDVHDAWLSLEHHTDVDVGGVRHLHRSIRRVVDLRSRRDATVRDAFGDSAARAIVSKGEALYAAARDSIRDSREPGADEARDAAIDLSFDARSFTLGDVDGAPAVTFVVPAMGERGDGTTLPLAPISAAPPAWWSSVLPTLPSSHDSIEDHWAGRGYTVRARYDSTGESALLSLADSGGREWSLGRIPVPVRHILWLDAPVLDSLHRDALARAFDDAVLYDDNARLASRRMPPAVRPNVRVVLASARGHPATGRRTSPVAVPVSRRSNRPRATRTRHLPT